MSRATLYEEHASVLPHWWSTGVRGATLVCVDAHLDLQFIAPERIARLRACTSAAQMRALESPHPHSPGRDACYGIEDFLYAAAQLGVIARLVWVVPPHVLGDVGAALASLSQMEGVTQQQLDSFARTPGGWIEGELLGLPIVLVEWQQLPGLSFEGRVIADIDADFFVRVPQDRVWTQPRDVVTVLRQVLGETADITIARSVGTGFLPLRHRFIADLLAALWEGRTEDAQHWQRLLDLEMSGFAPGERGMNLQAMLAQRPDCAATCYALSLAAEPRARPALRARAAALDAAYAADLLRELGSVDARRHQVDLATLMQLRNHLSSLQDAPGRLGAAWVALGLLHAGCGQLEDAIECDTQSLRFGGGHPDLALQIGRLEMARRRFTAAWPWLQRAAADDETRVAAWLHLSVCASQGGDLAQARLWAQAATAAAPAWREAQEWLRGLESRAGAGGQPGYDWASPARSSVG